MRLASLVITSLLGATAWLPPACAAAGAVQQEQRVLKQLAPIATRDGKVLSLALAKGQKVRLQTIDACATGPEDCEVYRLMGLSPDRQFFDIEKLGYESATRLWIARSDGKQYEVYAQTHSSPDGTHAVAANPAECCGVNGVFSWEIKRGRLVEEFRFEPPDYALYSFIRWAGPQVVELKRIARADKAFCPSSDLMETTATLTRLPGKWVLDDRIEPDNIKCE